MKNIIMLCGILLLGFGCIDEPITSVDQSKPQTYMIVVPGTIYRWEHVTYWETSGYGTEIVFTNTSGKKIKSNSFLIIEE